MKKLALAVFVGALALTGPAYAQNSLFVTENVAALKSQPPHANPFNAALQREYLAVGEEALAESDHQHADRYVRKGFRAGLGQEVLPENPATWWIAYGRRATLVEWYGKLMQVLPAGRTSRPAAAARAQVMYDCWLEEEHEDIWMRDLTAGARRAPNLYQPEDIAKCRRAFFCAMAEMGVAVPEPCVQTADINFRFDQPKSDATASRADTILPVPSAPRERSASWRGSCWLCIACAPCCGPPAAASRGDPAGTSTTCGCGLATRGPSSGETQGITRRRGRRRPSAAAPGAVRRGSASRPGSAPSAEG